MSIEPSMIAFAVLCLSFLVWLVTEIRKRHVMGTLLGILTFCTLIAFFLTVTRERRALVRQQELGIAKSMLTVVEMGKTGAIHEAWSHYVDHLNTTPPGNSDIGRGCLSRRR